MKNVKLFYLFLVFIAPISLLAQYSAPIISSEFKSSNVPKEGFLDNSRCRSAEFIPAYQNPDFQPTLSLTVSKNEAESEYLLAEIKRQKTLAKKNQPQMIDTKGESDLNQGNNPNAIQAAGIGTSFETHTNITGGCPSDNTVAVGSGYIVTAINSTMEYYNLQGVPQGQVDLTYLFQNLNLGTTNLCDPKLYYDSYANRFILYTQTCDGSSANSEVLVAVTQSSNPTQGWWVYSFSGNPLNDGSWFDFPKLGISGDYVFVTGNLFYEGAGYNQSIIYRIDKAAMYAGQSANAWYWYNLSAFTILPLNYGQDGVFNTNSYLFAATESGQSNKLKIFQLTVNGSTLTLNNYDFTIDSYSASGNAYQSGTSEILHTGDCRIADGYYLNGIIHFVHATDYNNYTAVRYYRFDPVANTYVSKNIFQDGFDYCYPSIASFSTQTTDKTAIINFFLGGASIYPQIRYKIYDDAGNTTSSTLVRTGDTYVDGCYDPNKQSNRWGDYSGFARAYGSTYPNVWLSGSYGRNYGGTGNWGNYVAQVLDLNVGIEDGQTPQVNFTTVPNPVVERTEIVIQAQKKDEIQIEMEDLQGKSLFVIYKGILLKGENKFSCNVASLASGIYTIKVMTTNTKQILSSQKIVVQ